MLNREFPDYLQKARISAAVMLTAVTIFFISSCMTMQKPQPVHYQALVNDQQLSELETTLDEIYHRVSVIQLTVDNNSRAIKDIEKTTGLYQATPAPNPTLLSEPKPSENINSLSYNSLDDEKPKPQTMLTPPLSVSAQPTRESVETIYNKAFAAYRKNDYDRAISLFRSISANYTLHDLADNALYWEGECLYSQKKFSKAITIFKKVAALYPDGSKVPDALLKTGYSYLSMNNYENGRLFLKKVIKSYPFSLAGTKAEKMLARIK